MKKIFLVVICSLLVSHIFAQKGIPSLEKKLQNTKKQKGDFSIEYAIILLEIAKKQLDNSLWDEAEENRLAAKKIINAERILYIRDSSKYEKTDFQLKIELTDLTHTQVVWRQYFLKKNWEKAKEIIDKDWIKKCIELQAETTILDWLTFLYQKESGTSGNALYYWLMVYNVYNSENYKDLIVAEKLWTIITDKIEKEFGKESNEYIGALYGQANFYLRTENKAAYQEKIKKVSTYWAKMDKHPAPINRPLDDHDTTDEAHIIVEAMPRFPGTDKENGTSDEITNRSNKLLMDFIYTHINYPNLARVNGIEGMAIIQFVIDRKGVVSDIKILRDPGAGTGEEGYRLANLMNELPLRWTPGQQQGKNVKVRLNMPLQFKLN